MYSGASPTRSRIRSTTPSTPARSRSIAGTMRKPSSASSSSSLYRIRRFEHLSGRSLASTDSLAEVWLAMRTTAAAPEG